MYLWNDLHTKRYKNRDTLSFYVHTRGEINIDARNLIEEGCFDGGKKNYFDGLDLELANLSGGHFYSAVFKNVISTARTSVMPTYRMQSSSTVN